MRNDPARDGFLMGMRLKVMATVAGFLFVAAAAMAAPYRRAVGRPAASLPKAVTSWTVEVMTSGGAAPSIRTGIVVRSSGAATLLNDRGEAICSGSVTSTELAQLAALVTDAHPESWAASYVLPSNPDGCCDQIRTTFRLTRVLEGSLPATYETSWFDDHLPLPADLTELHEAAYGPGGARNHFDASCQTGSTWSIEIAEEGGFAYRYHRVTVDSSGRVSVQPNPRSNGCQYTIGGSELQQLAALVRGADARSWEASYARPGNPTGCCDQIHTAVRLTRGEAGAPLPATYSTQWFSDHPALPADLGELHGQLFGNGLFQRFGSLCGPLF